MDGFPSTILLLSQPTAYRKGVDTSVITTGKDKCVRSAVPHRIELPSGELLDDGILRLGSVI